MGNLILKICCIRNDDITNNQNYSHNVYGSSLDKNPTSFRKSEVERLPASQIVLGLPRNADSYTSLLSASRLPITSKYVIISKNNDPFEDYEIIKKLGEGTYGRVYKVKNKIIIQ